MKTILLLVLAASATSAQSSSDAPRFTSDGRLALPKDYREWIYLSSGLGMTYGPAAEENREDPTFDNVFVTPQAYRAFLASGHWPDKTMFILELRHSIAKGSINKGGHYQSDVAALEAAVKDPDRFPAQWAYFSFGRGDTAIPMPATSVCNSCHNKNAAVENTFVQFYPTLLELAARKGTLNPAYIKEAFNH